MEWLGQQRRVRRAVQEAIAPLLPNDVADLLTWWKADALTGLSHNQAVGPWVDSSGNGHGISGGGAKYQSNVRNGLPGVLYDGSNDGTDAELTYGVSTNIWVSDLTQGGTLLWGEGSSAENDFILGGDDPFVDVVRGGESKWTREYAADWMNGPGIFVVRFGATAAACSVQRNGVEVVPVDAPSSLDPGSSSFARTTWLGTRDGDFPIGGLKFEHLIFNRALSDAEIKGLVLGLNQKWAIY